MSFCYLGSHDVCVCPALSSGLPQCFLFLSISLLVSCVFFRWFPTLCLVVSIFPLALHNVCVGLILPADFHIMSVRCDFPAGLLLMSLLISLSSLGSHNVLCSSRSLRWCAPTLLCMLIFPLVSHYVPFDLVLSSRLLCVCLVSSISEERRDSSHSVR